MSCWKEMLHAEFRIKIKQRLEEKQAHYELQIKFIPSADIRHQSAGVAQWRSLADSVGGTCASRSLSSGKCFTCVRWRHGPFKEKRHGVAVTSIWRTSLSEATWHQIQTSEPRVKLSPVNSPVGLILGTHDVRVRCVCSGPEGEGKTPTWSCTFWAFCETRARYTKTLNSILVFLSSCVFHC